MKKNSIILMTAAVLDFCRIVCLVFLLMGKLYNLEALDDLSFFLWTMAPQFMAPLGLLLLALYPGKYGGVKPLLIAGRLFSLVSGIAFLIQFIQSAGSFYTLAEILQTKLLLPGIIFLFDLILFAILLSLELEDYQNPSGEIKVQTDMGMEQEKEKDLPEIQVTHVEDE